MKALRGDIEVSVAGTGSMGCYLAVSNKPNGSVVVVLQEIFGVNQYIRSIVDGFADAGFVAIAPDLYWRQQPGLKLDPLSEHDRNQAMSLMKGLDNEQTLADAQAALKFARGQINDTAPMLAVGYCLGGKIAFLLAARNAVSAAVSYYGTGIHNVLDDTPRIAGRILLHIAQDDSLCPPDAQMQIASRLAPLGDRAQVLTYPAVGHAFARPGGASYNEAAAKEANKATLDFLQKALEVSA